VPSLRVLLGRQVGQGHTGEREQTNHGFVEGVRVHQFDDVTCRQTKFHPES